MLCDSETGDVSRDAADLLLYQVSKRTTILNKTKTVFIEQYSMGDSPSIEFKT